MLYCRRTFIALVFIDLISLPSLPSLVLFLFPFFFFALSLSLSLLSAWVVSEQKYPPSATTLHFEFYAEPSTEVKVERKVCFFFVFVKLILLRLRIKSKVRRQK